MSEKDNKKISITTYALVNAICEKSGYSFDDMFYLGNEKLMNMSVSIMLEIRELYEKGYTYEKVLNLIKNMDLSEENLEKDEEIFVRKDANKILNRIYMKREEK